MPDQVAAWWATAFAGATIVGAALTGLATRTIGYAKLLMAATMCFVAAMAIYCLPWSSEMQADSYFGLWTAQNGVITPQKPEAIDASIAGKSFVVLGSELKDANDGFELTVRFNRDVSPQTFTENDINLKDHKGKRMPAASVNKEDSMGRRWTAKIKDAQKTDGKYLLQIIPYIQDTGGSNLDMNGNGLSCKDHYRFIPVGVLHGVSFIGLAIALESLMYLFAPIDRRAGYFAAYRIIQFASPMLAFYASGFCFSPGNYKIVFMILLISALAAIWLSHIILKPVQSRLKEFSAPAISQEQEQKEFGENNA